MYFFLFEAKKGWKMDDIFKDMDIFLNSSNTFTGPSTMGNLRFRVCPKIFSEKCAAKRSKFFNWFLLRHVKEASRMFFFLRPASSRPSGDPLGLFLELSYLSGNKCLKNRSVWFGDARLLIFWPTCPISCQNSFHGCFLAQNFLKKMCILHPYIKLCQSDGQKHCAQPFFQLMSTHTC